MEVFLGLLIILTLGSQVAGRVCPTGTIEYGSGSDIKCCLPVYCVKRDTYVKPCERNMTKDSCVQCPLQTTLVYGSSSFNRKQCIRLPDCRKGWPEAAALNATHCECDRTQNFYNIEKDRAKDFDCQFRTVKCGKGMEPMGNEKNQCSPCKYGFFKDLEYDWTQLEKMMCKIWRNCSMLGLTVSKVGNAETDTVCAEPVIHGVSGKTSPESSSPIPGNTVLTEATGTGIPTVYSTKENTSPKPTVSAGGIGGIVGGLLLLVLVVILGVSCWRRKKISERAHGTGVSQKSDLEMALIMSTQNGISDYKASVEQDKNRQGNEHNSDPREKMLPSNLSESKLDSFQTDITTLSDEVAAHNEQNGSVLKANILDLPDVSFKSTSTGCDEPSVPVRQDSLPSTVDKSDNKEGKSPSDKGDNSISAMEPCTDRDNLFGTKGDNSQVGKGDNSWSDTGESMPDGASVNGRQDFGDMSGRPAFGLQSVNSTTESEQSYPSGFSSLTSLKQVNSDSGYVPKASENDDITEQTLKKLPETVIPSLSEETNLKQPVSSGMHQAPPLAPVIPLRPRAPVIPNRPGVKIKLPERNASSSSVGKPIVRVSPIVSPGSSNMTDPFQRRPDSRPDTSRTDESTPVSIETQNLLDHNYPPLDSNE